MDNSIHAVSINPGVHTPFTWYSPTKGIVKIGEHDIGRIVHLCAYMDKLLSQKDRFIWSTSKHKIVPEEKKTVLDVQFIKNKQMPVKNNNVSLYVTNQYGDLLPIYTVPIGGISHHNYIINFDQKKKTAPY